MRGKLHSEKMCELWLGRSSLVEIACSGLASTNGCPLIVIIEKSERLESGVAGAIEHGLQWCIRDCVVVGRALASSASGPRGGGPDGYVLE